MSSKQLTCSTRSYNFVSSIALINFAEFGKKLCVVFSVIKLFGLVFSRLTISSQTSFAEILENSQATLSNVILLTS